jgi:mRNA-degrading endonuclease RelE of RelBE toxin-antitoxin system
LTFEVKVRNTADTFIGSVPEKSRRIIRNALQGLGENPFPGSGGDKERLVSRGGREIYRLHIARTYTAFYSVDEEIRIARVHEILPIEQAHKKYGRL